MHLEFINLCTWRTMHDKRLELDCVFVINDFLARAVILPLCMYGFRYWLLGCGLSTLLKYFIIIIIIIFISFM